MFESASSAARRRSRWSWTPTPRWETVKKAITAGLASGEMLWLTDHRGREVGVPAASVAYVELDPSASGRSIGFGS